MSIEINEQYSSYVNRLILISQTECRIEFLPEKIKEGKGFIRHYLRLNKKEEPCYNITLSFDGDVAVLTGYYKETLDFLKYKSVISDETSLAAKMQGELLPGKEGVTVSMRKSYSSVLDRQLHSPQIHDRYSFRA